MTGENKAIKNEDDLNKIFQIYLSFRKLTSVHTELVGRVRIVTDGFRKDKERGINDEKFSCKRLNEYMSFCDDIDTIKKRDYIPYKESLIKEFFLLLKKYRTIKITPKKVKEEAYSDSDSVKERNRKIAQRTENATNSFVNSDGIFGSFSGHFSENNMLYDQYDTNFTDQLRKEILETKKNKKCN